MNVTEDIIHPEEWVGTAFQAGARVCVSTSRKREAAFKQCVERCEVPRRRREGRRRGGTTALTTAAVDARLQQLLLPRERPYEWPGEAPRAKVVEGDEADVIERLDAELGKGWDEESETGAFPPCFPGGRARM